MRPPIRFVQLNILLSWRHYGVYVKSMKTWVILIRGINVGGNNIVPMKELKAHLTAAGFSGVRTYIQSGNVAFESEITMQAQICGSVQACIETHFGFAPKIMALSATRLAKIIKDNPFPDAMDEPKNLHISFLARPAKKRQYGQNPSPKNRKRTLRPHQLRCLRTSPGRRMEIQTRRRPGAPPRRPRHSQKLALGGQNIGIGAENNHHHPAHPTEKWDPVLLGFTTLEFSGNTNENKELDTIVRWDERGIGVVSNN